MSTGPVRRLVVVGGGPSGLAAAWKAASLARSAATPLQIIVLEAAGEVGGKARTLHTNGLLLEAGPQGFLGDEPIVSEIVEACGLTHQVQDPEPAANRRYIYRGGKLRLLSRRPVGFARSGLLGPGGLARLALEPLVPARRGAGKRAQDDPTPGDTGESTEDESLFDFAARRLGRQAAERLISPVVLGIFAGDARKLSAAAAMPRLVAMEQGHGSLFRAMRAGRKRGAPPPGHRSFRRGIQSLPNALAATPGIDVRCGRPVTSIRLYRSAEFRVSTANDVIRADAVVLAVDLPAAARLTRDLSARAAEELGQIDSPPIAVVHAAFHENEVAQVDPAYGFLVARGEGLRMLGCQYESSTFSGRSPRGVFLLRTLFGGTYDPEAVDLDDRELVQLMRRELLRTAGITVAPTATHVARWRHAIPQYAPGHRQRVQRIEAALGDLSGFHLAGNALHGVGLGAALAAGARAGERAAHYLLGTEGP